MPRQPRQVMPGFPHQVTQRGNYRQNVFEGEEDFRRYCYWMVEYAQKYDVKILAYCLMNNHVHFIVVPADFQGMAQLFKIVHMRYSYYKNGTWAKAGHLWQGRFYSNVLTEAHLLKAMRYIERNPLRAGLVERPWDYVWASTREHVGLEKDPIIKTSDFDKILPWLESKTWRDYIQEDDSD